MCDLLEIVGLAFLGFLIIVGVGFTIVAGLLRCPKCGKWHDSPTEEEECKG